MSFSRREFSRREFSCREFSRREFSRRKLRNLVAENDKIVCVVLLRLACHKRVVNKRL